jgi:NADPH:quinone reductase
LVVLGAAGGVGLAAVQIGKALGAHVVAGVTGQDRLGFVKELGAHDGFTYARRDVEPRQIAKAIKDLCGPAGADVVLDAVGGPLSEGGVRALGWNGRLLIVGFPAGIPALAANLLLLKGGAAIGVFYGAFAEKESELDRKNMEALLALYQSGALCPVISSTFKLADAAKAIAELSSRNRHGKIVVTC